MATSHKLVKTDQVGFVLLDELSRNTQAAQDILEATKQGSECAPDGILPDPDLKTMRQVFEEKILETAVKDAFEPYRDGQIGNGYDPKQYTIFNVNFDYMSNGLSSVILPGVENNGEVPLDGMVNSVKIPLVNLDFINQNTFELYYDPNSGSELMENFKVFNSGIYCFTGEFSLQIYPADILNTPEIVNSFYPPDFIRIEDDEVKYRITLQQFVGGNGPYDEVPFSIIDNFVLAEGSFSKVDIAKGERRQAAFNVILRANTQDRFRMIVERSRVVGTYPNTGAPDALVLAKTGTGAEDPYAQNRDPSNYIACICLVRDNAAVPA
jgi:hypothetical protein